MACRPSRWSSSLVLEEPGQQAIWKEAAESSALQQLEAASGPGLIKINGHRLIVAKVVGGIEQSKARITVGVEQDRGGGPRRNRNCMEAGVMPQDLAVGLASGNAARDEGIVPQAGPGPGGTAPGQASPAATLHCTAEGVAPHGRGDCGS